jgi:hypothetical protein
MGQRAGASCACRSAAADPMGGITREKLTQFRVRFAELEGRVLDRFRPPERVVDPYLVARAVVEVMRHASMRSAAGRLLAWNEYRVILAPGDLEPMRVLAAHVRRDIEAALAAEARRLGAELVGDLRVHLVADEGGELALGEAVIRADFVAAQAAPVAAGSDMTVRADARSVAGEIRPPVHVADPAPSCVVTWTGGHARVPAGVRTVLGRPHAAPPAAFVPLTGASTRVSKQQLWIEVGTAGVAIGRFEGANPVEVAGTLVEAGQEVHVATLPAQVSLSRGELVFLMSWG